jgi:DDE superfamily endonuclease
MTQIFAYAPFYSEYVKQLTPNDHPSLLLLGNPKLCFFARALGAIDGSHINLAAPSFIRDACRNRKGFISQNCLFCCSFNLLFTYALTGWEGSAADARVYADAIQSDLKIPDGWYLLADAGFPHCKELLVPYRGVRYHLQEWGKANVR